jgi:glycosyltransferase involved in cell wall biosynthesis
MLLILSALCLSLAAIPAGMFFLNVFLFRRPRLPESGQSLPSVSVLIPARDEEANIRAIVAGALASEGIEVEVIVLDDNSCDRTAGIVSDIAATDPRLRLESAPPLPDGWCGKQRACALLAEKARQPLFFFVDADVRLAPDAIARMVGFLESSKADLVSGIPRQITGTFFERLLIPFIHFMMLAFLPFPRMRRTTKPAFAAGCGQVFLARAESYRLAGGHTAIRASLHDGIMLPRAFRRAGFRTDLCDITEIVTCRMYRGADEVFSGLLKNATEGMAGRILIWVFSALLFVGQVLPLLLLAFFPDRKEWPLVASALACGYAIRFISAARYRQSWLGALFHPLGVLVFLGIQWTAWFRARRGVAPVWKGRAYGN